ncbi:hypothetical protein ACUXST_002142 [Sphingomonas sp. F9_3S_D5_B_2]
MAHGYLGDGYGKYGDRDPDGGRENDRGDWRGEHRDEWRERGRQGEYRGERGRGGGDSRFMFEGRDRVDDWQGQRGGGWDQSRDRGGDDRGFFSQTAEQAREWFRDDEHDYRPNGQQRSGGGSWGGQQGQSRQQPSGQNRQFGSHQDDHYLSWRQQQMDALDRDYQDYCRERQQQFHQDFSSWRSNRQSSGSGGGSQQSAQDTELELNAQHNMDGTAGTTTDPGNEPQSTIEPNSAATLGTNNSENSFGGRGG